MFFDYNFYFCVVKVDRKRLKTTPFFCTNIFCTNMKRALSKHHVFCKTRTVIEQYYKKDTATNLTQSKLSQL